MKLQSFPLFPFLCLLGFFLLGAFPGQAFALISNGANAVNGAGQLTEAESAPLYTKSGFNNGPNAKGLNAPASVLTDTVNHRLFVSDAGNHRVLVFNLNASNLLTDYTADFVLGQTDFVTATSGTTQAKLNSSSEPNYFSGLAYDSAGNRLFVVDYLNNRVMVFDVASITNGENAVNVLGQANFTASSIGTTQATLYNPQSVTYDSTGNRLFVADTNNQRIMVFDVATITNGENAVNVLGQANFVTNDAEGGQAGFYLPNGLAYDSAGSRLFVSDNNYRVMVFDVTAITDGENAASVLGPPNFNTVTQGTTQSKFYSVSGLTYDSVGSRLFVTDATNNRVMVFDVATITNGENAVSVLGQTDFTTATSGTTQAKLNAPNGLAYDSGSGQLFVADVTNNRVMVFDAAAITNGESAANAAGQLTEAESAPLYTKSGINNGPNTKGMNNPVSVLTDAVNHRLFVSDAGNNRVLVFNLNTSNQLTDYTADFVLGQTDFVTATSGTTQATLNSPSGLTYDSAGNRLFVTDVTNNRVMVFDVASITNGENAVNVLGQTDFVTSSGGITQAKLNFPNALAYDSAGSRLFVANGFSNHRVMVFDVTSITDGENAVNVLGQTDFVTATTGTTQVKLNNPSGLAYDSAGNRLFVTASSSHRVMVFDVAAITNGENAVNVLGQTNFTSSVNATTQSGLFGPRGLSYDSAGNRLFVADATNNRVMVFDVAAITDGESAVNVLGQTDFVTATSGATQAKLNAPSGSTNGLSYESGSGQLFVADSLNNRVMVFDATAISSSGSSTPSTRNIQTQIELTLSLGEHRNKAFLRLVNQLLKGERMIKDRVTLGELLLSRADGLKEFTSMSEILSRPAFRSTLLQMASENPEIRSLLRGQQSDRLILEVWKAGESLTPVASLTVATNIFGEATFLLPSLPAGTYDFTIKKPLGLKQSLLNQTLSGSMTLAFPKPLRVADFNSDGLITIADLKIWIEQLKSLSVDLDRYDLNEDGTVDIGDFTDLLAGLKE